MDVYIYKIYDDMLWDYFKDFGGGVGFGVYWEIFFDLVCSIYVWILVFNIFWLGNWGIVNNIWLLDWWGYFNIWKINYVF